MDEFAVIRHPLTTEACMARMEHDNTLTFIVDVRANKNHIKQAIQKLYNVKPIKVNTLIRYVSYFNLILRYFPPFFVTHKLSFLLFIVIYCYFL